MVRTCRKIVTTGCLAAAVLTVPAVGPAGAAPDRAPAAPAACLVALPAGWTAALTLRGGRTLDATYSISTPMVWTEPPRLSLRSRPELPVFSLDARRSGAAPTYLGVLRYTDAQDDVAIARVIGTWSDRSGRFWGSWIGASGQRGTAVVELVRTGC